MGLTRQLYVALAPGGSLYVGNQTPESTSRWAMEYLCDWKLIYRTRPEMLAFAREGAPDAATVEILEERTGVNPLVHVAKA